MAYGVVPPLNGSLVVDALFDAFADIPGIAQSCDGIPELQGAYGLAQTTLSEDSSEPLIDSDISILGNAANELIVPASVANGYAHAGRVAAGIVRAYIPAVSSKTGEPCGDDMKEFLTLCLGVIGHVDGSSSCLSRVVSSAYHCDCSDDWRAEVNGELQPYILKIKESLGDTIRQDCAAGETQIADSEGYLRLLQFFERANFERG